MNRAQSRAIAATVNVTVESFTREILKLDNQDDDTCEIKSVKSLSRLLLELNDLALKQNERTAKEEEGVISARNVLVDKKVKDENELSLLSHDFELNKSKREREVSLRRGILKKWKEKCAKSVEAYASMIAEIDQKSKEADDIAARGHESKMKVLEKEKEAGYEKLKGMHNSHKCLEEEIWKKTVDLKEEREKIRIKSRADIQAQQKQIHEILMNLEDERRQKAELERHFDKVDMDIKEQGKEEEIVARVIEMEKKAEEILNNSAIIVQKIVRSKLSRLPKNTKAAKKKRSKGKRKTK